MQLQENCHPRGSLHSKRPRRAPELEGLRRGASVPEGSGTATNEPGQLQREPDWLHSREPERRSPRSRELQKESPLQREPERLQGKAPAPEESEGLQKDSPLLGELEGLRGSLRPKGSQRGSNRSLRPIGSQRSFEEEPPLQRG